VREPKVVVQTTSEIDILDDRYRWRQGRLGPKAPNLIRPPKNNINKFLFLFFLKKVLIAINIH
jgi:hypothetical protein